MITSGRRAPSAAAATKAAHAAGSVRSTTPVPDFAAVRPTDSASTDGTTFGQWAEIARDIAATHGLALGDRVLVDAAADPQPVSWLLAPLTAGASVVVCANLDRATVPDIIAAEGITHVW